MLSSLQQRNGIRPLTGNAYGMLYGAAILLAGCVATGQPFRFDTSTSYMGALLYLAIPGSVIGSRPTLTLVGRMGPARAPIARCCSRWWRCRSRPMRKAISGRCRRCWAGPGDARQSAGLHQVDAFRAPAVACASALARQLAQRVQRRRSRLRGQVTDRGPRDLRQPARRHVQRRVAHAVAADGHALRGQRALPAPARPGPTLNDTSPDRSRPWSAP